MEVAFNQLLGRVAELERRTAELERAAAAQGTAKAAPHNPARKSKK